MGRHKKVYALYKGDEYLDEGTIVELAAKWNRTPEYLRWTNGASRYKALEHRWGMFIVPIEEDEECW